MSEQGTVKIYYDNLDGYNELLAFVLQNDNICMTGDLDGEDQISEFNTNKDAKED